MGAPSFLISLCRYAVVILPVALALSYLIGPAGVWHAFWLAEGVTAAFSLWLYRRTVLKIPAIKKTVNRSEQPKGAAVCLCKGKGARR